jgi:hypothetical protein
VANIASAVAGSAHGPGRNLVFGSTFWVLLGAVVRGGWFLFVGIRAKYVATQGHGFNILSAISGLLVSIICYAFVDHTDIIHAAASTSVKCEEVIGQMQDILDCWGGLLWATGGALVPKKSYWYALSTSNGWVLPGNTEQSTACQAISLLPELTASE